MFIYYCHGLHSPSWKNSFVSLQLGELVEYTVCWGSVQSARTKSCYCPAVGAVIRLAERHLGLPRHPLPSCWAVSVHGTQFCSPVYYSSSGTLSLGGVFVFLFFGGGAFGDQLSLCSSGLKLTVICFSLPSTGITGPPHSTWLSLDVLNTFSIAKIWSAALWALLQ